MIYPMLSTVHLVAIRGFSLLELLLALLLIATLSVMVLPQVRFNSLEPLAELQQVQQLLHLGQHTALVSGCDVQVRVNTQQLSLHYTGQGQHAGCIAQAVVQPLTGSAAVLPTTQSIQGQSWVYQARGYAPSREQWLQLQQVRLRVAAVTGFIKVEAL